MKDWWLLIPLLSAFIGWIMVKLFIRTLFYPLKRRQMLGFTYQGIIPKNRLPVLKQLTALVKTELFSLADLEEKILSRANFEKIIPEIEVHIDHFLAVKLKEKMPMVGMFVGERTLSQLKEVFMEELEILFPAIMKSYMANLEKDLDIIKILNQRLESIPDYKISEYIKRLAAKQLKSLTFVGAFGGFVIGMINMILFLYK